MPEPIRGGTGSSSRRPLSVTVLAWLLIISGGWWATSAIGLGLVLGSEERRQIFSLPFSDTVLRAVVLSRALSALQIVMGIAILRGQNWARPVFFWIGAFATVVPMVYKDYWFTTLFGWSFYLDPLLLSWAYFILLVWWMTRPSVSDYLAY